MEYEARRADRVETNTRMGAWPSVPYRTPGEAGTTLLESEAASSDPPKRSGSGSGDNQQVTNPLRHRHELIEKAGLGGVCSEARRSARKLALIIHRKKRRGQPLDEDEANRMLREHERP